MKKIGIVTFWRNNYGSVLQSYALKSYIEKIDYHVDILNERYYGIERYYNYIKKNLNILKYVLKYKEFGKYYINLKKTKVDNKNLLSKESRQMIETFINIYLNPLEMSYKELKKYAHSDETESILAGSDQIWNCSNGTISPYYFLKFVPKEKRIAVSPSFGASKIPEFLKNDISEILKNFRKLSVREEQGKEIIKDLIGKDVERLPDPVVLYTKEEWRNFYGNNKSRFGEPFVLIHFLDEPNELALTFLEKIPKNIKIINFAYKHEILKKLDNIVFIDGSPQDYIYYIDNAEKVFTDSFHTTMFSIIMNSDFYVFERKYKQVLSQQSRIENVLNLYEYKERLIKNESSINYIKLNKKTNIILMNERNKLIKYLNNSLVKNDLKKKIKNEKECTGCGLCIQICPKNAILKKITKEGYWIPQINKLRCINCELCDEICNKILIQEEIKEIPKEAYVYYNQELEIRKNSASGGAFSAIATKILEQDGIVYGANISFNNGIAKVEHIRIDNKKELYKILGSKYVQSDCNNIYKEILKDLLNGKKVLFGGTSCQVNALYKYLANQNIENLYTIDLICHGVPGVDFFNSYVYELEKKYKSQIIDFKFRKKINNKIEYSEIITMIHKGKIFYKEIPAEKSSYYRLFLLGESYRKICYDCEYASINKPADITVGDYFELQEDYPELYKKEKLNEIDGISCVIIHTKKGKEIFKTLSNSTKFLVDINIVQKSHQQLYKPMKYSKKRERNFKLYNKYGYKGIELQFIIKNLFLFIPRIIKYKILKNK